MVESLILEKLIAHQSLPYVLIFLGMIIEGELFLFAGIFLATTGYLNLGYVISLALIGMISGDIVWYWLGTYVERFIPKKVRPLVGIIDAHLLKRPLASIFLAKFIYFLHRWVLARARPVGISFRAFLRVDAAAAITWVLAVSVLGLAFSASFYALKRYFHFAEIGLLIGVLALGFGEHYLGKYLRKKFKNL